MNIVALTFVARGGATPEARRHSLLPFHGPEFAASADFAIKDSR
jgi:hypothetical protein